MKTVIYLVYNAETNTYSPYHPDKTYGFKDNEIVRFEDNGLSRLTGKERFDLERKIVFEAVNEKED